MANNLAGTTSEIDRRRVQLILRDSRIDAGLTQQAAAKSVLWSPSKLIRVEGGANPPAPADVRVLMLEYGASQERVAEAVELAQSARQPNRWDVYKDVFSPESRGLFANEGAASLIHKHESSIIPGLLQTENYARLLLRGLGIDPPSIDVRVQVRLERQEILASEASLEFVLGEAAISMHIGDRSVMRAQIEHLQMMARRPNITLRLIPFAAGPYPGFDVGLTILEFRDPDLPDLVYLESGERETLVRDPDTVDMHLRQFSRILEIASPPDSFVDQLDGIAISRYS